MNYRMVGYLLGVILSIEAALLFVPMLTALLYGEPLMPFVFTILILLAVSVPALFLRPKESRFYAKDGFVCVAGAWILLSMFGALPFVFSGAIPSYVDAVFETVSGFTTTGATILSDIESLPKGILLWRSFTHWIGGMGVLVFMLAILPSVGGQAIHLLRAETTGPQKGKLVPKMKHSAMILYAIYFALSVLMAVLLLCTGMPLYDSIVSTFATAGTGGFSVLNDSIAGYHNPAAEWIISVFMVLFGVNFNLYFFLLLRRYKEVLKNEELRVYLILCMAATAVIAWNVWDSFASAEGCIRTAFFQAASIISTTGFSTVNYDLWPDLAKTILLCLMVVGSCAGSTAGGLKVSRVILMFKNMGRELKHLVRPNSVNVVRMDGEAVPTETQRRVSNYVCMYVSFIAVSVLLLSVEGFGFETHFTSVLTCINNVGPGLAKVGPAENFADYSVFSKLLLSLNMLIGRLEILPMLVFFTPTVWKKT
ncbi:MAG: TrkH family potassium uptake protein [Ruminococcaceae bacterium]|nr:TrkH family potassium uptake protein [Oscillospiraceae bacterium]